MKTWVTLALMMGIALAGCTEPEPPPEEKPPPPPSASEIANALQGAVQPLTNNYMQENALIPDEEVNNALSDLRSAKQKYMGTENATEGFARAKSAIGDAIVNAQDAEAWPLVIALHDALKQVDPQNSSYDRIREQAELRANRPRVDIQGFFNDTVFIEFYLPETEERHKENVQVGDEFYGMKLEEIIGNNKGVRMLHQETGDIIEVPYN